MKKIFSYQLEESDLNTFKMNELVHFSIIPYHKYINEDMKKIINSLTSGERVYTQKMCDCVIMLIKRVREVITNKEEIAKQEITMCKTEFETFYCRILLENYHKQQQNLNELEAIFRNT